MKISDLLKDRRLNDSRKVEGERNVDSTRTQPNGAEESGDKVTISVLGRKYSQVSELLAEDEAKQRDRVEELKRRIADGTYDVSSENVARALISFTRDNNS